MDERMINDICKASLKENFEHWEVDNRARIAVRFSDEYEKDIMSIEELIPQIEW